jgi:hypothetical protein
MMSAVSVKKFLTVSMDKSSYRPSTKIHFPVEFQVITNVYMKRSVSWDIKLCSPLKVNQQFDDQVASIFRVEE